MRFAEGIFEIEGVSALQILDSRGRPTIRVCVQAAGIVGCADAPAGASRGKHEAVELRDGGSRLMGYGVKKAVFTVENIIGPAIKGMDVRDQIGIDKKMIELDGTSNKSKLGGNSIVATSMAVARTAAMALGMELFSYIGGVNARYLPVPMMNVINGGVHAGNELDFQEFMIVPIGGSSFSESIWIAAEVYMHLRKIIKEKYGLQGVNVGDEGGFAPPIKDPREALNLLSKAVEDAGYKLGSDVVFALDIAASQMYDENKRMYKLMGEYIDSRKLLEYYLKLVDEYPIKSIEDPFYEEDFESFAELNKEFSRRKILVVGDDIYTTNPSRLSIGIEKKATTGVIVKINQIGTVTEALEFIKLALSSNHKIVVSHRSGDTEDPFIADFAVGVGANFIKTGAPCRGERIAKYNRLLEIEKILGDQAVYQGAGVFK